MSRRILYVFVLALTMCFPLTGQTSRIMYFMDLPQQRFLNPAFQPSDSMYIGIPVLTGVGLSINNNFITFSDVIMKGRTDSLITFLHPDYDKERFLRKMKRLNSVDADAIVQLLGFGISLGKGYLFFDLNERIAANSAFPREMVELVIRGNEGFAGKYTDFSALGFRLNYYREAGIGYSRDLGSGLRAGFRAKFLYGIASGFVDNRSLGVDISPDLTHSINTDMTMNFSGRVVAVTGQGGEIDRINFDANELARTMLMKNSINPGFSLDIGLTYDISEQLRVSAAVTDLGMIMWRNSLHNFSVTDDNFQISGVDVSDVVSGRQSFDQAFEQLLDTLQNQFAIIRSTEPFNTTIPTGLSIGGNYNVLPGLSVGLLSNSRFSGRQVHQSVTLSANYNPGNKLSASLGYTAANNRYDNIGAGVAYRIGVFQFYAATDRVPLFWNRLTADEGRNSFLVPANWNTIDFRCGMNLVFGHRKKTQADECDFWYR